MSIAIELCEASDACALIDQIAEEAGLTELRRSHIRASVSEACAAMACATPEKRAMVMVGVDNDLLEVEIESPASLQFAARNGQPHACGMHLASIAALVDDLRLHARPQGGTAMMLAFRLRDRDSDASISTPSKQMLDFVDSPQRLRSLFDLMPDGFMVLDDMGRCVYANQSAIGESGLSRNQLLGTPLSSLMPESVALEFEKALTRAKHENQVQSAEVYHVENDAWNEVTIVPLEQGLATFSHSVTGRVKAQQELRNHMDRLQAQEEELRRAYRFQQQHVRLAETLLQISTVLHGSLYGSGGVDRSLSIAASTLNANIASIERLEDGRFKTTNVTGTKSRLPGRIIPIEKHPVGAAVMETMQAMAIDDPQQTGESAVSNDQSKGATLAAPCVIMNEVVGLLSFEFSEPRHFELMEIEFVSQLASLLSLALENAELYQRQQSLLDKLQQSFLYVPEGHPEVQFAHDYRSATEGAHVGGDFHDLFMGPDGRMILVIGDVSGRGLEASRISRMTRDGIRVLGMDCTDPARILQQVNRLIFSTGFSGFVTSFVAVLDYQTGEIAGASAGHPPPLLVDRSGVAGKLEAVYKPPLGSFPDTSYESVVNKIEDGDTLLLFTDGLTEARRDGELFGEDRLMESLQSNLNVPLDELPAAILRDVLGFANGTIRDDSALLALKYVKPQPAADLS